MMHIDVLPCICDNIHTGVPPLGLYRCFIGYVLTRLKPSVAVAKGFLGEYNQPVVRVEVGGVIVSVDPRSDKISYVVDDGTGCIPCIHWRQKNEKNEVVDTSDVSVQPLGTYVHMQGYLGLFRGNIQLTVKHVVAVADPNAECCHWLQTMELTDTVYRHQRPSHP
eukprot:m.117478 g.117478  ORF g.117478 m.117478 type:complete len:165 (+) comp17183_c0_seq52:691-1185(+)